MSDHRRSRPASPAILAAAAVAALAFGGLTACEKKGPVEQVAEEIDEGVDTLKNGKESTASKVDDAIDDVREGAQDAADELKK